MLSVQKDKIHNPASCSLKLVTKLSRLTKLCEFIVTMSSYSYAVVSFLHNASQVYFVLISWNRKSESVDCLSGDGAGKGKHQLGNTPDPFRQSLQVTHRVGG